MTPIALLLATLALILLPLALFTWRQRSGRAARIAQAWRTARDKERMKSETLAAIERRLEGLVTSELALLQTVRNLQQRISALPENASEEHDLEDIRSVTASAIQQLAELMESQVDIAGEPRLKAPANQLAARHADSGTAIARLQDVLQADRAPHAGPDELAAGPTADSSAPDGTDTDSLDEAPIPALLDRLPPAEERRIH